jgi:aryl-alcohol dehydrogenase-like predicted oxidoreductase
VNGGHVGRSGIQAGKQSFGSRATSSHQLDIGGAAECMSAAYAAGVDFFDWPGRTLAARQKKRWARRS